MKPQDILMEKKSPTTLSLTGRWMDIVQSWKNRVIQEHMMLKNMSRL